ncbi:MAG: ATP-binding cassette domain-containing protein, partial [Thaumarchaeota archaeon]|nr:ATP-binding cassette domain-containing protein [Nitrososphaerota archaeon]
MSRLELKGITKNYENGNGGLLALNNIDLTVNDGEFLCIVGPSGCGKSTLLNIVAGLEKPDSGEVLLDGRPVNGTSPDRLLVFQEGALFPWLTVMQNVEFGLKISGVEKEKRDHIARKYLEMMHLSKFDIMLFPESFGAVETRRPERSALGTGHIVRRKSDPFAQSYIDASVYHILRWDDESPPLSRIDEYSEMVERDIPEAKTRLSILQSAIGHLNQPGQIRISGHLMNEQ